MQPITSEEVETTKLSSQNLPRNTSATDGSQPSSIDARRNSVSDGTTVTGLPEESSLPVRQKDSKTELELRQRMRLELSQDVPKTERLEAAESLIDTIRTCTVESLETLWEVIDDMTVPEADLESRKVAFNLFQASALHLGLPSYRTKIFNMITTPVDHSAVRHQLMALDQLIQQGRRVSGLEAQLAGFLIELMRGLFPSAERARQARYRREGSGGTQSGDIARQRPDEEKALLKCLSLILSLVEKETETFKAANLETMLAGVVSLASKTTGTALMRAFFEIISAVTVHSQIPNSNAGDCVRLLCLFMVDPRYESKANAATAIYNILHSGAWQESLNVLVAEILVDTHRSSELKGSILQLLADSFMGMKVDSARFDVFSEHLRSACRVLCEDKETSPRLIDSLVKLATTIGAIIDLESFKSLNGAIQTLSKLSAQESVLLPSITENLVKLFLACMTHSGPKTVILYDMFLSIVAAPKPASIRLTLIKLLSRLRCDASCRIKVIKLPDGQGLAAALCRTKATAANVRVSASPSSHASSGGQSQPSRRIRSRASDIGSKARSRSRSVSRISNTMDRFPSAMEPMWKYDESRKDLPVAPPEDFSSAILVQSPKTKNTGKPLLDLSKWLEIMISELEKGNDWEVYSYILVHLPSQLSNCSLFQGQARQISDLHELLNTQLSSNSFPDPPPESGIRRGDIALCLYHSLAMLLAYQDYIGVRQWNRTVSTFRVGIEKFDRVGKFCIHALALCCHEIPNIVENHINVIVEMMQKRITQSDLAMDILEFLGGLARLPEAYDHADVTLRQKIFGICVRYLQHAREQRKMHENEVTARGSGSSADAFRQLKQPHIDQAQRNLAEYVFTIAYQVIIFWFLAIDVRERNRHVGWITRELAFKSETGKEEVDEQSLVLLDMMHRTAFSDLGETFSAPQFSDPKRKVYKGTWLVGMSVITAEVVMDEASGRAECGQFTKRQASGTTHAVHYHNTIETPLHHVRDSRLISPESVKEQFSLYPSHMVLQLISTISPAPAPLQPIPLPEDDDFTNRALRLFDSTDTVDGHKAAVIYIGDSQTTEEDILANTEGSDGYNAFLSRLGTKVPLKNIQFNAQGLDRQCETDGSHTYAWRDRVTEIVFHIPTMMPNNLEMDPSCSKKKAHIGNDHVKIIFNESGLPFEFNTFASDFNSVNIVITPEAHTNGASPGIDRNTQNFTHPKSTEETERGQEASATDCFGYYLVQAFDSYKYPDFSPVASPKIISASALPGFVRQLAMDASVFCQVWQYKSLGEYTSSWRFRLQQIIKLREKYANVDAAANVDYPRGTDEGPSSYVEGGQWIGNMTYGGMAELSKLIASLDFTRWTK